MQKTIILILSFLISIPALTQEKQTSGTNLITTEAGYIFSGDYDLTGVSVSSEYQKQLGKRFEGAISVGIYNFFSKIPHNTLAEGDRFTADADVFFTGLRLYFIPVSLKKIDVEIGVGGNANFTDKTEVLIRPEGLEGTSIKVKDNSEKYVAFAPLVSAGMKYRISDNIGFRLRGFFQQETGHYSMPVTGIGCGLSVGW